jgi:thiol-disulfide isomerase/thioredoxin
MLDVAAAPGSASPNLVASDHRALLTWLEPLEADQGSRRLRISELVAGRWTPPRMIAQGPAIVSNWADVPSVVRQDAHTLVAHWAEQSSASAEAYDVIVARSTDDGQTWQRLGPLHRDHTATEHGFVSLVPDGDAVLAVWLDGRGTARPGGATSLRGARIREAIGEEELLDDRVCDCCSTSAVATASGPVVVYRDRSEDELRDPAIARRTDSTWQPPRAVHHDRWQITGCPVNGPVSAAIGRDLAVGWYTYADQRPTVRVAFSQDAGATFADPIVIDESVGARAPVGRVDTVLVRGDEAIVSWMATERERAHLLARRVARDGRLGAELEIATLAAGRDGGVPRMERLDDDLLLAWTDAASRRPRVARIALADVPAVTGSARRVDAFVGGFPVGSRADDYTATLLDGASHGLRDLRGSPVLLNVWATWCEPCRAELPLLARLQARLASRGLRTIALSVDRDHSRTAVAAVLRRRGIDLETWFDPADRASAVFGVGSLPTTLLFDASGVLVWRHEGAIKDNDPALTEMLDRVLIAPR